MLLTQNRTICFAGIFIAAAISTSCTKSFEAEYSDPNKVEIISDKWNETDARKTAETMIKGMLSKNWLRDYKALNTGKKPIVIVDEIENRTDEHIDTQTLTEFIRDELINSGQVRFLNKKGRQKIVDEVKYQNSGAVAADKAMQAGKQLGAQYFLGGALASNVQVQEGLKTITYQTNLTLTNLQTSELEWSEKYRIKKRMQRSGSSW